MPILNPDTHLYVGMEVPGGNLALAVIERRFRLSQLAVLVSDGYHSICELRSLTYAQALVEYVEHLKPRSLCLNASKN